VSPSFRTAVNIPQNIWPQFRDKLYAVGASLLKPDSKIPPVDAVQSDWSDNQPEDIVIGVDVPASTPGVVGCYGN